jgi:nucleoside-diphosphate-sugar epimerase
MRILVTGATGVVGRRAVPLMIREGHHVTAVGRSAERLALLKEEGASVLVLDLFDREAVKRAVAGQDAVVNLATHIPRSGIGAFLPGAWMETDRIREHASALLVDEALAGGVSLFVQESFAPIYPDSGDHWVTEDTPPRPATYNRSALKAEASADRFTRGGGRGVVLRFAFFYGPGDDFTREVFKYVRRGWLPIVGPPEGFFSTVNHDDAASAVVAALHAPPGTYNVVDNEPLTRRELGVLLSEALSVRAPQAPPWWMARLAGSIGETMGRSLRISNAKLRDKTEWIPTYLTARDGWRRTVRAENGHVSNGG